MHPKKRKLDLTKYGLDDRSADASGSSQAATPTPGSSHAATPTPGSSRTAAGNSGESGLPQTGLLAGACSIQVAHTLFECQYRSTINTICIPITFINQLKVYFLLKNRVLTDV